MERVLGVLQEEGMKFPVIALAREQKVRGPASALALALALALTLALTFTRWASAPATTLSSARRARLWASG